MNIYKAVKMN